MKRASLGLAVVCGMVGTPIFAAFTENFDGFTLGSIGGQGGGAWDYIGPSAPYGADVVNTPPALSGTQSLRFTDDGNDVVNATRYISAAESEGDGSKISFSFKSLQPPAPSGVTGLLMEPFRQGIDINGQFEFSPIVHSYLYVEPSGTIFYADSFNGTSTTLFSGWQADTWYRLELTMHIAGDNLLNDVALIDVASNSVLASVQGLTGGLSASRHYYSRVRFTTDSSRAGSYLMDDFSLKASPPGWAAQSGDWNVAANWTGGTIPNAVDAQAQFGASINSPATVYSNTAVTVGQILFDNPNTYVLSGAGSLTVDVSSGAGSISVLNGSHKINLPLTLADNTTADIGSGAKLTIADPMTLAAGVALTKTGAGTLSIEAPVTNAAPATIVASAGVTNAVVDLTSQTSVNVSGGTLNLQRTQHLASLSVTGGKVVLASGTNRVVQTDALSITGTGKVDLTNGKLIVNYTGSSVLGSVASSVAVGSLTSSISAPGTVIAFGEASDLYNSFPATFAGETVDSTTVLAAYTIVADANLDGTVNSSDFNQFVAHYGVLASARWTQGDFDGDGKVTTLDFNLLAGQFGQTVPAPALGTLVPEPASLSLLCGVALLLRRRR